MYGYIHKQPKETEVSRIPLTSLLLSMRLASSMVVRSYYLESNEFL